MSTETTTLHTNLLPGLLNNEVEFFAVANEDVKCINNGRVLSFEEFPQWVIARIEREIEETQSKITDVRKFIYFHFGGLDSEPDLTADGVLNYSEYFDLGNRTTLLLGNGSHLTPTEIEVLKRIYLPNKLIADEMYISIETVNSHIQNIMRKLQLGSKIELGIFGTKKGIIKPTYQLV